MAVSGSTDFNQTESTIIRDALVLIGGIEDDEVPTAEQESYARRALNRMVKAWSTKGLKAWCWNEVTIATISGQAQYEIGPTAATLVARRILQLRNPRKQVSGGDEVPMRIMSRSEYMDMPKNPTGEPVALFYHPEHDNGQIYVWPKPDGAYSIKFSAKQYVEDFDTASNNAFFPVEWLDAIVYNLAIRLCPKYSVRGEELRILNMQAREMLQDAENGDAEEGSLYIGPEVYY